MRSIHAEDTGFYTAAVFRPTRNFNAITRCLALTDGLKRILFSREASGGNDETSVPTREVGLEGFKLNDPAVDFPFVRSSACEPVSCWLERS